MFPLRGIDSKGGDSPGLRRGESFLLLQLPRRWWRCAAESRWSSESALSLCPTMLHCKLSGHVWKSENASSGQLPYSWSLTPPMAEGFEFLRVRETGTKGSNFLASQHQAQNGTSETVTRVRIFRTEDRVESFGFFRCSKNVVSLHTWKSKNVSSGQLPYSWSLAPQMAEGFGFLQVRETVRKGSNFWRRSTKRRRARARR